MKFIIGFSDYTDVYVDAADVNEAVRLASLECDAGPVCAICNELNLDISF